jgi:signal transduction histidine kinase/CheY-like chemotaxis protein
VIKLVSSSREITQRKQAENALCDSQEQLQRRSYEIKQLYEFSREIGYTVDFIELTNVLNEYLYRLLPNLSCSSLILTEKNWHDWYHLFISSPYVLSQTVQNEIREEILKILRENHNESMVTEQLIPINPFDLEGVKTSPSEISCLGTTRCISLIDSPSEPLLRKVVGTLWLGAEAQNAFTMEQLRISYTLVNHLVNALKRIHVLLDQERKHLENLVQYLPIGIILLDAQRRIILANLTAQEYLPLFTEAAFNSHFLTGKIASLLVPLFESSSSTLKAQLLPVNSQSFEITALLLEAGPYMGHYITIINDVTERHRMEAELQAERASLAERVEERTAELSAANMKLAKANQLKDEFLANMSHELRTPLNAILGGAEILIEQIYGSLTSEQFKYINNIYTSSQHLLSLINDILDLSKIEAGKMELQYGNVPISELCQASLLFIKQLAYKKQIQVRSNISSQLNMLRADQRCLKQIFINLLNNAVKFTPAGGEIELAVRPDPDKQAICFSVTDTGIGIAPENMSSLFKPFEQLDSGLARQYGGIGLGLALVQRLVELHGGSITVESQLDQGSCFTVTFPHRNEKAISAIIDEELSVPLPIIPSRKNGPTPLILLAEDNQITIDIFVDYLRNLGYRMNIVRTGKEALDRLAEERPDLILMDIQMPGMDGLEATRSIRAQPEYKNLPIIALTALTMPGDRERCLEAGVNDYLSKPANIRELIQIIEKYL